MNTSSPQLLVDFSAAWKERFGSALPLGLGPSLEKLLGISRLNRRYAFNQQSLPTASPTPEFWSALLASWDLDYSVSEKELEGIPAEGPVILTANHPFGFVDGLILCGLLARRRGDLKLLANQHLGRLPELSGMILPVNNYGGPEAARENLSSLRDTLRHLKAGGAIATFPAGEVSTLRGKSGICDGPWHANTARLVRLTNASVVPVFFHGSNGPLFHAAGLLSPAFRTALLPREFLRRCGRVVSVRIGQALPSSKISGEDDQKAADFLRATTYALAARPTPPGPCLTHDGMRVPPASRRGKPTSPTPRPLAPLAPPSPPEGMAGEIANLPARDLMVQQGGYRVILAPSWRIPLVLNEIGRERERAFRLVGEGSGLARDLDRHDRTYLHLVLWDAERNAVAGAYRLGRTDIITRRLGLDGLYTHSLFRYQPEFFQKTGPALELGRSFVAPEYQRKPQPLHLLWRGLGEFVLRNPRYRRFIGPVSMSADYQPAAQALVTAALGSRWADPELSSLVSPTRPSQTRKLPTGLAGLLANCLRDESDLSHLVAAIQPDNSGLPILLKHYLRLNARAVACNIDRSFGNCLDTLIVVDLLAADPKMLVRYLGEKGAAALRAHHAQAVAPGEGATL